MRHRALAVFLFRLRVLAAMLVAAVGARGASGQEIPIRSVAEQLPWTDDLPPPVPPAPAGEPWSEELQFLLRRIEEVEACEGRRLAGERLRKEADATRPSVKWTAQLQADYYSFGQDRASRQALGDIKDGEAFRRARVGIFGDYGPAEYRIEVDFALSGRPSFLDVYAGLHDLLWLGRVRVGHFFEPFSLERLTPNRFVTFMERSLPDQPFAPARNTGMMANNTYLDERGTWAVGLFRSDSDIVGDETGDEFESAVTGRVTWLPWIGDGSGRQYVHLGSAYSFRDANDNAVRFRSQPEARIGSASPNVPYFVDTGTIPASSFQLAGFEAAWVNGPFSLQSEYVLVSVDATAESLLFHGWYATASYFLTGEHRPYRRDCGTFGRVIPRTDFVRYSAEKCVNVGPGAWEVAARVSQLDLNDADVHGGRLTDVTLGVNWYLNPYLRVTANYIHAMLDDSQGRESDTNIFGARVGFDF